MSKANIVMDATLLDTLQSCEAKFNYRFNMNKVTPFKPKPLDTGTIVHLAHEKYFEALKEHRPWDEAVTKSLGAARIALMNSDLTSAEGERIIEVLEECHQYWRLTDINMQICAVERPFLYVLYEDENFRVIMIGKIDLLFSDNIYTNCPMDHKSYTRAFPVQRLGNQFTNYATAVGSKYLFVNRIGFQTSLKPNEKYKRIPLSYDDAFIRQWKQNVLYWAFRYWECTKDNVWPMNTTSCDKYNRLCEYHGVCDTSGEENKIYKLETNFKTAEPWDVSKTLENKGE